MSETSGAGRALPAHEICWFHSGSEVLMKHTEVRQQQELGVPSCLSISN